MQEVQVKLHPNRPIHSTIPKQLPNKTYVISYETHVEAEGNLVLKFKNSMLVRADGGDVEFVHQMDVKCGFIPPSAKPDFQAVCYHCYQSSIIEFNKSLDNIDSTSQFIDAQFEPLDDVMKKIDNALNPNLN